jgi:hypothetical protein
MPQQGCARHAPAGGLTPPQHIQNAHACRVDLLESCRWPDDHAPHVIDDGDDGEFLEDAGRGFAVEHVHVPRHLQWAQRAFDLPTSAGPLGEVGHTGALRVEARGDQGDLAGPEARRADRVADRSEHEGLWQGRHRLPGEPCGASLRLQPRHAWVVGTQRGVPA